MSISLLILLVFFAFAQIAANQELAKAIRDGDKDAFKRFFDLHYNALVRYLNSLKCDKELAEDLVQNAFLYIWEHRDSITITKSLKAYLFKIAYSKWINASQRLSKQEQFDHVHEEVVTAEHTEDQIHHNELHAMVLKLLNGLPEKRQQVFRFCFLEEFTYKETAEIMGISVNTVENHMQKAFSEMRLGLQKRYPV